MTRSRWLAAMILGATASSAAIMARADEPEPLATASASASASVSASAAAPSVPERDLRERPPPGEESDHPKPDEWSTAETVALARPLPSSCHAKLLREWLRIRCESWNPQSGAVLAGDTEDVFFFMVSGQSRMMHTQGRSAEGYVTLELPLRRGDRRLIQLTESDLMGYGGLGPQRLKMLLSIRWLDDENGPTVTATQR